MVWMFWCLDEEGLFGLVVMNMNFEVFIFGGSMVMLIVCDLFRNVIVLLVLFMFEEIVVVMNLVG